jgi:quinol-cytochrome oxidoreductase complex cytochrome b subunit
VIAVAKLVSWLDDRTGWARARARLGDRTLASTLELHLAALFMALLVLLVASGVLLMMHYRPNVAEAHMSVVRIDGAVHFGALVRGVHAWSSDGLVALAIAYPLSLLIRGGYRRPGELLWIGALFTLFVVLCLAFSGALLVWGERTELDARAAANAAGELPVVGSWLRRLLLGGDDASAATLPRAFGFHVAVLPATLTLLLGAQAALSGRTSRRDEAPRLSLYPEALLRFAIVGVGALAAVVTLATFVSRPPAPAALAHAELARPPWYLGAWHALARLMPERVLGMDAERALVGGASMTVILLVFLPFLDPRGSRFVAYLGWILLAALTALTIHGMV